MRNYKKVVALGLSLCVALSVFAGCGNTKKAVETDSPVAQTELVVEKQTNKNETEVILESVDDTDATETTESIEVPESTKATETTEVDNNKDENQEEQNTTTGSEGALTNSNANSNTSNSSNNTVAKPSNNNTSKPTEPTTTKPSETTEPTENNTIVETEPTVTTEPPKESDNTSETTESNTNNTTSTYVPGGGSIWLDTSFKTVNVNNFLTAPQPSDFGNYYNQAMEIYNGILNKSYEVTIVFDIEGTSDSLSNITPELDAAMKQAKQDWDAFLSTFNSKVLNGHVSLTCNKASYYSATFIVAPVYVYEDLVSNKTGSNAYYDANIAAGLYDGMSEKDAVSAINRYICNKISYSESIADPITALNAGAGNCAAYTGLFYGMCENAGIACQYIHGYATNSYGNTGPHGWNRVNIGGNWYYIDVCWNDSTNNSYYLSSSQWSDHNAA